MCAINPTHKKRIIFDVYTSDPKMTKELFEKLVIAYSLDTEINLNTKTGLRWHVKETDQPAD